MRLFIVFAILTNILMPLYIYVRCIRNTQLFKTFIEGNKAKVFFIKIFCLLLAASPSFYFMSIRREWPPLATYFLALFMGLFFLIFFSAVSYEIIRGLCFAIRPYVTKTLNLIIETIWAFVIVLYIIFAFIEGNSFPELKEVHVKLANFPYDNFKILMLTDMHIGQIRRAEFLKRCVETVNKEDPDLIVITGDLIDDDPERLRHVLSGLKNLKSKWGTYFVTGNHEYHHDTISLFPILESFRVIPLRNKTIQIGSPDKRFNLSGINDVRGVRYGIFEPNISKMIEGKIKGIPTILLTHQLKLLKDIHKEANLILSGHTHGGQIFPIHLIVKLVEPYLAGLYKHNDTTQIYVSRGTGLWGPPIRLFAPAEITKLIVSKE